MCPLLYITCRANSAGLVWADFRWVAKDIFCIFGLTCKTSGFGLFFLDFSVIFDVIFWCFFSDFLIEEVMRTWQFAFMRTSIFVIPYSVF